MRGTETKTGGDRPPPRPYDEREARTGDAGARSGVVEKIGGDRTRHYDGRGVRAGDAGVRPGAFTKTGGDEPRPYVRRGGAALRSDRAGVPTGGAAAPLDRAGVRNRERVLFSGRRGGGGDGPRPLRPRGVLHGCVIALAAALFFLACQRQVPVSADVAARIAGQPVPYSRFEEFLRRQVGEGAGSLDSRVLSRLLDQFLDAELLTRLAVDEKRLPAAGSQRQALDSLLADADAPVVPAEVEQYYRLHQAEFALPERVRLHHLLVASAAEARRIEQRLQAGEDFPAVAREVSLDPSAPAGGDQGDIGIEDLPAPFAQQIAQLAPGDVGEPIQASDGWHVFRLDQRLPPRQRPLDEVAGEITDRLRRQRSDALLAKRLQDAADRYNVVVYAQNLPFDYRGAHPRADQKESR